MAESPIHSKIDLVGFTVLVGGEEIPGHYQVVNLEVIKELNQMSTAEIVILDGDPAKADFEILNTGKFRPGKEIKINMGYHSDTNTVFEGVIVKQGVRIKGAEHSSIKISCIDKLAKMTMLRRSAYFSDMTDSDIMGKIIGTYGLSKDIESTSVKHKKVVQYNATDWDFIITRAEMNGQVVRISDNKITIAKPDLSAPAKLTLTYGSDIVKIDTHMDAQSQLQTVECSAWDMATQKMITGSSKEPSVNEQGDTKGSKMASVLASEKLKLQTPGSLDKNSLKDWANAQMLKSRLSRIRGTVAFQGNAKVFPGDLLELKGVGKAFNGNAFISKIVHTIEEGNWITEATMGVSPEWFAESKPNIAQAPANGMLPPIAGLHIGVVTKIHEDPDGETRVQLNIPTIDEKNEGIWARMTTPYASEKTGIFFMPEISDEVVISFLNEDPRFPVILGSLYSKKHNPPFTPDEKNTFKGIVTKSQLKVTFDDDKKIMVLETPAKNKITLDDDAKSIIILDCNNNKISMTDSGITMESPKDIILKAQGNIKMEATQSIGIKAGMDLKAEGMNITNEAQVQLSLKGMMAELKGSGMTTVKGGMVMIN